jgi:phage terminase large subunit-like protein
MAAVAQPPRLECGGYWLLDMVHARANPGEVERLMVSTATQDGKQLKIGFGQDPGQGALGQCAASVWSDQRAPGLAT